jgi:hypothetical protein
MATGVSSPIWPLPDVTRRRWTFGAPRGKGKRHHAGVDLYAPKGSIVLAPESGRLISRQRFNGPQAIALLMQTDSGVVILFGEVLPGSWKEFGHSIGSTVEAGEPIARVGVNPGGSQMLHYEMYTEGTRQNARWYVDRDAPPNLLNPTSYLKTAVALDASQKDPIIKDEDPGPGHDHDHDDDDDDDDDDDKKNTDADDSDDVGQDKIPPKDPTQLTPWGGVVKLALLFGVFALLDDLDG